MLVHGAICSMAGFDPCFLELNFWSCNICCASLQLNYMYMWTRKRERGLAIVVHGFRGRSWERCPGTRVVSRPAVTLGVKFLRLVREHLHLLGGKKGPKTKTTIKEKISHKKDGV